jgi:molybdate transport system substrate-binding protein
MVNLPRMAPKPDSTSLTRPLRSLLATAAVLAALVGGAAKVGGYAAKPPAADLTVSAAISLQNTLQDVARLYHSQNPQVAIHLNLGASGTLQRQIEQGAPVDLFVSAAPSEMNALEGKGLIIRDTRKDLVTNSVVLITPKDRPRLQNFQQLSERSVKTIAIGNPPSVPAGAYAREILTHLGIYARLEPKFVLAKDVRAVLTYVETGNADAGIVYKTDALTSSAVRIDVVAPPGSHSPVVYPVAVISGSRNAAAARTFESFLFGPQSAAVFRKYGFDPVADLSDHSSTSATSIPSGIRR